MEDASKIKKTGKFAYRLITKKQVNRLKLFAPRWAKLLITEKLYKGGDRRTTDYLDIRFANCCIMGETHGMKSRYYTIIGDLCKKCENYAIELQQLIYDDDLKDRVKFRCDLGKAITHIEKHHPNLVKATD